MQAIQKYTSLDSDVGLQMLWKIFLCFFFFGIVIFLFHKFISNNSMILWMDVHCKYSIKKAWQFQKVYRRLLNKQVKLEHSLGQG